MPESEPVVDELAPVVTDAVGERDTDRERLVVELGEIDDVAVFELVDVLVDVPLPEVLGETLELSEILAVALALAPNVTDGVAEFDSDALRLDVEEGVTDDVPVLDVVSVPVLVCEGVDGGVEVADNVAEDVGDGVKEDEGVPLAVAPADSVVVGVAETVVERLDVVDTLSLPDGVWLDVHELDPVPDPVGVIEPVGVDERVIVVEPVPESEPVFDELAPAVTDAVGVREMDRERLVVELGVVDEVPVSELVEELVGVPVLVSLEV